VNVWKVVCATLVIFVAGIITGAALVRFAELGPRPWRTQHSSAVNHGQPNPHPLTNPNNRAAPGQSQFNQPLPPTPGVPAKGLLSLEFVQLLERQLRLTPDQREQIGKIMAGGQERVRALRSSIDPGLRKELQQTREQIRAVLTPDQREQFEQMMKRSPRRIERGEPPGQPDRSERRYREPPSPPPPAAQDP